MRDFSNSVRYGEPDEAPLSPPSSGSGAIVGILFMVRQAHHDFFSEGIIFLLQKSEGPLLFLPKHYLSA
jgi:hypothetical protein